MSVTVPLPRVGVPQLVLRRRLPGLDGHVAAVQRVAVAIEVLFVLQFWMTWPLLDAPTTTDSCSGRRASRPMTLVRQASRGVPLTAQTTRCGCPVDAQSGRLSERRARRSAARTRVADSRGASPATTTVRRTRSRRPRPRRRGHGGRSCRPRVPACRRRFARNARAVFPSVSRSTLVAISRSRLLRPSRSRSPARLVGRGLHGLGAGGWAEAAVGTGAERLVSRSAGRRWGAGRRRPGRNGRSRQRGCRDGHGCGGRCTKSTCGSSRVETPQGAPVRLRRSHV